MKAVSKFSGLLYFFPGKSGFISRKFRELEKKLNKYTMNFLRGKGDHLMRVCSVFLKRCL